MWMLRDYLYNLHSTLESLSVQRDRRYKLLPLIQQIEPNLDSYHRLHEYFPLSKIPPLHPSVSKVKEKASLKIKGNMSQISKIS